MSFKFNIQHELSVILILYLAAQCPTSMHTQDTYCNVITNSNIYYTKYSNTYYVKFVHETKN